MESWSCPWALASPRWAGKGQFCPGLLATSPSPARDLTHTVVAVDKYLLDEGMQEALSVVKSGKVSSPTPPHTHRVVVLGKVFKV